MSLVRFLLNLSQPDLSNIYGRAINNPPLFNNVPRQECWIVYLEHQEPSAPDAQAICVPPEWVTACKNRAVVADLVEFFS